jgi:hypothetical protein
MAVFNYICPKAGCPTHAKPVQQPLERRRLPVAGAELYAIQCTQCGHVVHVDDPAVVKAISELRADMMLHVQALSGALSGAGAR